MHAVLDEIRDSTCQHDHWRLGRQMLDNRAGGGTHADKKYKEAVTERASVALGEEGQTRDVVFAQGKNCGHGCAAAGLRALCTVLATHLWTRRIVLGRERRRGSLDFCNAAVSTGVLCAQNGAAGDCRGPDRFETVAPWR